MIMKQILLCDDLTYYCHFTNSYVVMILMNSLRYSMMNHF